jgi:PsbP
MYKKAVFCVQIVSFTIFLASTSLVSLTQGSSEFTTYTDTNNGFTLQYPSDWTKNDTTTENFPFALNSPDNSGTVFVTALRPGSVSQIEIFRNMTLDELVKSVAVPAGALSLSPNELSALGVNILELNSEEYFLSGHPSGRIVMTLKNPNGTSKMMGLATIANDGLYAISYMADATTYNQYLADAQSIIDSFEIISRK